MLMMHPARAGPHLSCGSLRAQKNRLGIDIHVQIPVLFGRYPRQQCRGYYPQFTLDMTEENWDLHMNVNAKSILCSQAAARQMRPRRAGCIINIGSILGRNAFPATLGYCASKAAVDHMTRVLAIEWAKYGIRVNCIAPGYVRTDLIDRLAEEGKLTLADLERRTPQRRLGSGGGYRESGALCRQR